VLTEIGKPMLGVEYELPSADSGLQLLERLAARVRLIHLLWIEKRPDGIGSEIVRRSHPLGRSLPIAEIITLQLDEVPVRVFLVQRHGDTVIERESRDDALVPHPGVG
jgi:hypothetical protein